MEETSALEETFMNVESTPLTRTCFIMAILGALPCSWKKPLLENFPGINGLTGRILRRVMYAIPDRPSLHPLRSSLVYSLIVYAGVSLSAFAVWKAMFKGLSATPPLTTFYRMITVETLVFLLPFLITPIAWMDVNAMKAVLSAWDYFGGEYKRVIGSPLLYKRKGLEMALDMTIAFVPGAFFVLAMVAIPDMALERRFLISLVHGNMVQWAVTSAWIELCICMADASVFITEEIQQQINLNGLSAEKLQDYRALWLALRAVPDAMGSLGSPMVLFTISLILITLIVYQCIVLLYRELFLEAFMHIVACFNYVYQIFTICNNGHQVSEQMKLPLDQALAQVTLSSFDAPTKREIMMFFLVGNAKPTTIILCGFLEVNKSLFASMIGTVSTYLIVLVQFNLPTKEDIVEYANNTEFTTAAP